MQKRYTRYFVYLLETGQRDFFGGAEKDGHFCVLLNAKGVGRRNLDFAMMKVAGPIIELNYPERQYRTFVLSVGTVITMAWRAVSNFLDPGTVFKIRLVGSFADRELLEDFTEEKVQEELVACCHLCCCCCCCCDTAAAAAVVSVLSHPTALFLLLQLVFESLESSTWQLTTFHSLCRRVCVFLI
jgi:hypothetical protein